MKKEIYFWLVIYSISFWELSIFIEAVLYYELISANILTRVEDDNVVFCWQKLESSKKGITKAQEKDVDKKPQQRLLESFIVMYPTLVKKK